MTSLLPTLYTALHTKFNRDRKGVHVSDIALCPREAVFRRLEPQPIDNTQLGFFVFGESAGSAIQALVNNDPERWIAEYEVKFQGLEAHVDLYDKLNNVPIEVKTANTADMDQPKPHYLQQLRAYMAMLNAETGIILVFLTQHFRGKQRGQPFREWVITMTKPQILEERKRLVSETRMFLKALEAKDPLMARGVLGDKELSWKCDWCHWLNTCQEHQKAVERGA